MNTACRWAVSCPAANCAELGCECAAYMVKDEMKLANAVEKVTPHYVCFNCGVAVTTAKFPDKARMTHRGSCDICGEFDALYQASEFELPVQVERPVTVRRVAEKL